MNWINASWWALYACLAIVLQASFAGVDFLLPGFIVAIQERRAMQLVWVFSFFLLLQEGLGSLAFGGALLWYSLAIILFYLGYALFEVESFLFIFLLSGCLSATHVGVTWLLAGLQDMPVNLNVWVEEGVAQALITPVVWRLVQPARRVVRYDENSA